MTDLKLTLDIVSGEFAHRMGSARKLMAEGMTAAMDEAVVEVKTVARNSIARAGFSTRWQNTLRVDRYPRKGVSMVPSAYIFHKIPYAGVFEEGAHVAGKPMLWLPLASAPARVGRLRTTVANLIKATGQRLLPLTSKSGKPLLAAVARLSGTMARQPSPRVSVSTIRKGAAAVSDTGAKRRGTVRTIPMFVGLSAIDIPKKFGVTAAVDAARAALPAAYARNLAARNSD